MLAFHDWGVDASANLGEVCTQHLTENHRVLRDGLVAAIFSRHNLFALGDDPLLAQLMRAVGFKKTDYVAIRCLASGERITLVALATCVWIDPDARAAALQVKAQAADDRTRSILIPERSIVGNNRGRAAALIARGRNVSLSSYEIDEVMGHVRSARISTLADCALALPNSRDPVGAVLAMIARGFLDVDRCKPITTSSWITSAI